MKNLHRGDFLGLPGSYVSGHFMALLAGLSLQYLSISGLVLYFRMWNGRRKSGKLKLFW